MDGFPTKILAATDGSEHAVLATHAATDLSLRAGAELHVVHVWQEPRFAMTLPAVATGESMRVCASGGSRKPGSCWRGRRTGCGTPGLA